MAIQVRMWCDRADHRSVCPSPVIRLQMVQRKTLGLFQGHIMCDKGSISGSVVPSRQRGGINRTDTHQISIFSDTREKVNQLLCSSYSSCYLCLPHAFIFIWHWSINSSSALLCAPRSLALWLSLPLALGVRRYWNGNIGVYEARNGTCHHCIYSTVCVSMLWFLSHTKTCTVWVELHDGYSAVAHFHVVVNDGWMYARGTLLCWCLSAFHNSVSLYCLRECVCVCVEWVRETVWFWVFGLIWCDWPPLSLFTHLFSCELTTKQ